MNDQIIKYELPSNWIDFDFREVSNSLIEAKAAIASLRAMPYQREWLEKLHALEFKREVAGTSRIEGADFTEKELDLALDETAEDLVTRSQRQARAAVRAYRWIATIPDDRPIDEALVLELHHHIVLDADDDHCVPGQIRRRDEDVHFGQPRHRGANGGKECQEALSNLVRAINTTYREHDPIIQALAVHYHVAAMHPFLDGNGRTARALEALMLQRAGLRDTCFIAMSNYYYDEKTQYLTTLSDTRAKGHDLTTFLIFGLKGIHRQTSILFGNIKEEISKSLFRNTMYDLFHRLKSPRKRVIVERQLEILKFLLTEGETELTELIVRLRIYYQGLKKGGDALFRDLDGLLALKAIYYRIEKRKKYFFGVRLNWPMEVTEDEFLEAYIQLPQAKTNSFLDSHDPIDDDSGGT